MDHTFLGIDVGGTKIAAATLAQNRLSPSAVEPTQTEDSSALVEQIVQLIDITRTPDTHAVGIGVPSVVEFATGRVRGSVNIPLHDLPLRTLLSERVGLPVFVENDASCAAFAEAHDEQGRLVCRDLVMFTVGTGVGGGLVLDGRLYRGATGAAAELGHQLIGVDMRAGIPQPSQRFPQPGSLEDEASGRVLDRLGMQTAQAHPDSRLGKILQRSGTVAGRDVVLAAQSGDEDAIGSLRTLGERLGIGVANAINTFDPSEVVIGGGVSTAGELIIEPATRVAKAFALPGVGTTTQIRLARHGVQAGVLGAALIAAQETESGYVAQETEFGHKSNS